MRYHQDNPNLISWLRLFGYDTGGVAGFEETTSRKNHSKYLIRYVEIRLPNENGDRSVA